MLFRKSFIRYHLRNISLNNINDSFKVIVISLSITFIALFFIINPYIVSAASVEKQIEIVSPGDIAVNSYNGNVYVLSSDNREIIIVDGKMNNIIGTIPINFSQPLTIGDYTATGGEPISISHNPTTNRLYVAVNSIYLNNTIPNNDRDRICGVVRESLPLLCNILVIDGQTNKVNNTIINRGFDLQELTIDDTNNKIYVVNGNFLGMQIHDLGNITIIDGQTDTIINTIPVGDSPRGIAFDKNNNKIYVANQLSNNISVIDSKTNETVTLPIEGGRPIEILFNSFNGYIYFTDGFQSAVSIIDTHTNDVIDTIPIGDIPNGLTFNSENGDVYVTKGFKNEIAVIDGQTNDVIDTIPVGNNPINIAFNNFNNKLYVSNLMNNTLSIINIQE